MRGKAEWTVNEQVSHYQYIKRDPKVGPCEMKEVQM